MATIITPIQTYNVIVHEAEEGGYWGEVLELPGCVSQGETLEEFRHNIREAIEAVLQSQFESAHIEFQPEPILAQKDTFRFGVREQKIVSLSEASDTWTWAQ